MLTIKSLEKSYGERKILQDISVVVPTGKTLAIIGASGCGKSTLLKCIGGILPYEKGSIQLDGIGIENCRQEIGFNFQEHNLFPWLKVHKNLSLGLLARKYATDVIAQKVERVAEDLGIGHLLQCYPNTLSGGEKQRVAIGRILAYEPSLLLLDEPSSALDAITKEKFQDTLVALRESYPLTTVIVTHSIEEAVYLADTIMVMQSNGNFTIHEVSIQKSPHIRKDVAFFEACKQIREALEGGMAYE